MSKFKIEYNGEWYKVYKWISKPTWFNKNKGHWELTTLRTTEDGAKDDIAEMQKFPKYFESKNEDCDN